MQKLSASSPPRSRRRDSKLQERPHITPRANRLRLLRRCVPLVLFLLLVAGGAHLATPALAQVDAGLDVVERTTALGGDDIRIIVARIIRSFLGLLGIVGVVIVLYGGFLWMTAGGEEDKLATAKRILVNGAIGLIIVLSAFAIAQFVLSKLQNAVGPGSARTRTATLLSDAALSGALGAGPIVRHFPVRDANCESTPRIPPNTRIFITFRDSVRAQSFVADTNGNRSFATAGTTAASDNYRDLALPEAIQVAKVGADVNWAKLTGEAKEEDRAAFNAEAAKLTPVGVALAADQKTVVLSPVVVGADGRVAERPGGTAQRAYLEGDARHPVAYVVRLTSAIQKADSSAVFTGAFRDGYAWSFTVCADADTTPPKIERVIPFPDLGRDTASGAVGAIDQPRNAIVQVNFNEAMDPTVTTGTYAASDPARRFQFLGVVNGADAQRVSGTFELYNEYRTVEFTTSDACGQNSCGGTVYCLPGDAELRGLVDTATLETAGEPTGIPFSGVMDAAGNALDGNGNGTADGPGDPRFDLQQGAANAGARDSVRWTFFTTNRVDLTPPTIDTITHISRDDAPLTFGSSVGAAVENVSLTAPFSVVFTKLMSGSTADAIALAETTGGITACDPSTGRGCLWYRGALAHEPAAPATPVKSRVMVTHPPLRDAQPGFAVPSYRVHVDASAKDVYQNCFFSLNATPRGPQGPHGGESCVFTASGETCQPL